MAGPSTIRIFISSPSDVRPERVKAEQIIRRLNREFAYHFRGEPVLWEREPLVAIHHFQDERNIPRARHTDIVVAILWSRLGVPLPEDKFRGAISGRAVTGTEWEFEDALASARESGVPDLLLYRKTARVTAELDDDAELEERRAQRARVRDFIARWFTAEDGQSYTAALHTFETAIDEEPGAPRDGKWVGVCGVFCGPVQADRGTAECTQAEPPSWSIAAFEPLRERRELGSAEMGCPSNLPRKASETLGFLKRVIAYHHSSHHSPAASAGSRLHRGRQRQRLTG